MELEGQNVFKNLEQQSRLVRIGYDSFSIKIHVHIGNCSRQNNICWGKVILPDGAPDRKKLVFTIDCHLFRAFDNQIPIWHHLDNPGGEGSVKLAASRRGSLSGKIQSRTCSQGDCWCFNSE